MWGREVVFIMKSVFCHEFSKGVGQFEDGSLQLITHCQDEEIVLNVQVL